MLLLWQYFVASSQNPQQTPAPGGAMSFAQAALDSPVESPETHQDADLASYIIRLRRASVSFREWFVCCTDENKMPRDEDLREFAMCAITAGISSRLVCKIVEDFGSSFVLPDLLEIMDRGFCSDRVVENYRKLVDRYGGHEPCESRFEVLMGSYEVDQYYTAVNGDSNCGAEEMPYPRTSRSLSGHYIQANVIANFPSSSD